MKKFISLVLILIIAFSALSIISTALNDTSYDTIVTTATPTTATDTQLKWLTSFGGSVYTSPTPPVVTDDAVIVLSTTTLYKLDLDTGEVIASVEVAGSSGFNQVPVLCEDGKIFVQMTGGMIQAFDYESLTSLWIFEDELGGQALSTITYSDGYIYTGFWNGETKDANYVCVSVEDENPNSETESKSAVWTYTHTGGFYWAGAVATTSYVYFGTDDGTNSSTGDSKLICVNKYTGEMMDEISLVGDLRSNAVYYDGRIYISSKAGYVYSVKVNTTTGNMASSLTYTYQASGQVTTTPIIYNSRLYIGAQNGTIGEFIVLDVTDLSLIYSADMLGNPQGTMLLSNYYEESTGCVYIYSTYNQYPGGITVFEDSVNQTTAVSSELYAPESAYTQYGVSNIVSDANGNLYYKNDSGYIFCLESISANDTDDSSDNSNTSMSFFEIIANWFNELFAKIAEFFTGSN